MSDSNVKLIIDKYKNGNSWVEVKYCISPKGHIGYLLGKAWVFIKSDDFPDEFYSEIVISLSSIIFYGGDTYDLSNLINAYKESLNSKDWKVEEEKNNDIGYEIHTYRFIKKINDSVNDETRDEKFKKYDDLCSKLGDKLKGMVEWCLNGSYNNGWY